MRGWLRIGLIAVVLALPSDAAPATAEQVAADALLTNYLRTVLKGSEPSWEETAATATQVQVAWTDLNADSRPEAIVYVSGRGWCGSGGCRLLVLERNGATFVVRGKLAVTRPPIGLLSDRTSGWRNLTVYVAGGGIIPGYRVIVPFDGKTYASNPTVSPARRLGPGIDEEIVIPATQFPFLGS